MIALALSLAAAAVAADAPAKRCGWIANPTPGNWWITDRAGETVPTNGAEQGGLVMSRLGELKG